MFLPNTILHLSKTTKTYTSHWPQNHSWQQNLPNFNQKGNCFEALVAHTFTPATSAKEANQSGPAPIAIDPLLINQHKICTPLRLHVFVWLLVNPPDQAFVSSWSCHYIIIGFDIGYSGPHAPSTAPNLPSASLYPHTVDESLNKEIQVNCIADPYLSPPLPNPRCSGLGVVPKKTVDGALYIIYLHPFILYSIVQSMMQ